MPQPQPAIEGWFTSDDGPAALLGTRCGACGTYFFPAERLRCRNPRCGSNQLDEVRLSTRGTLWSYTDAQYQPPPPYVPTADEHEPFAIAAVHLEVEKMVVLGQVPKGVTVADLQVGQEMELIVDTLFDDPETDTTHTVWKWRPVDAEAAS